MMKRTRLSESNCNVVELFGSYDWEVAVLRSESGITLEYAKLASAMIMLFSVNCWFQESDA